jgi:cation-transporting ATPase E
MRNNVEQQIHIGDIVVGEIIKIVGGMDVPVDGIVVKAAGVMANEAAMTGESDELAKDTLDVCMAKLTERNQELGGK